MVLSGDKDEWREALGAASPDPCGIEVDPDAPAGIAYTSGTTGYPKGAVHGQRNLLLPGAVTVATRRYGHDLRKGDCLALTILNMMVLTTLLVAQAGGRCVIMDRIDAEGVAEWIRRERVTTFNGPPALLYSLAHHPGITPQDLASLNDVWSGGADCPEGSAKHSRPNSVTRLRRPMGSARLRPSYPSTPSTVRTTGAPAAWPCRTSGFASPTRAAPTWPPVKRGRSACRPQQAASGPVCTSPCWGTGSASEATAAVRRGGELLTGDLGFLDPEGYLVIRDRTNLVIIRGGANVYPAEVERILFEHPAVVASAVLGLPDERLGERVVSVVQLEPGETVTEDDLRQHCLASLAKYKVPERFVFVDGFDRNSMGKIVRRNLRTLFDLGSDGHPTVRLRHASSRRA